MSKGTRIGLAVLAIAAVTFIGCARSSRRPATMPAGGPPAAYWTLSERGIKSELIVHLKAAPRVLVLGGSRALRIDPAVIRRLTGLTAFNAAVEHATPQDEWCFVNLLHRRFPHARFAVLWVVHCDELDQFAPGASLLEDPFLSRFLPAPFVDASLDRLGRSAATAALAAGALHPSVIAPDGFTLSDSISAAARQGTLAARVARYTAGTLSFYRHTPPRFEAQPRHYFELTVRLLNDLGVRPVIVLAPLQPRYLAAIAHHGWNVRHRLMLAWLRRLARIDRFSLLDFSRLSSIGGSPAGFYDAVHLRPTTAALLVAAVVHDLPHPFALSRASAS